jgi:hypothetical protein
MLEAKEVLMKSYLEEGKFGPLNDAYTRFLSAEARYHDKDMWRTSPDTCIEAFQEMIQESANFIRAKSELASRHIPFIFDSTKAKYVKTPLLPHSGTD